MQQIMSACIHPTFARDRGSWAWTMRSCDVSIERGYRPCSDRCGGCAGEDKRTTLMIKNIPNKYTQKMLLATIDEDFRGHYDFFYLPIDFKNKCNVGYAFINMVCSSLPLPWCPLLHTFSLPHPQWFSSALCVVAFPVSKGLESSLKLAGRWPHC